MIRMSANGESRDSSAPMAAPTNNSAARAASSVAGSVASPAVGSISAAPAAAAASNDSQAKTGHEGEKIASIAVLGAMEEEVTLLAKHLVGVEHTHEAGLDLAVGYLVTNGGNTVRVVATVAGMGTVAAAAAAQFLITRFHPRAVIFSGIAGNLTTDLDINDVVIGGTLRYIDSDMELISQAAPKKREYHSDPTLIRISEQALDEHGVRYKVGVLATGNRFIDSEAKRADIRRQIGVADAAEMEGAAVAHVAEKNGVPVLVIRALSDNTTTEYQTFRHFDISDYADTAARVVISILRKM